MRRSTLLISTSLIAIGFTLVAHAATPIAISDFHISSIIPADEALKPYCAMANRFDNGLIVTHSRNNFGLGSLSFDFPDVAFDQGKNYQITVKAGSITRRYAAIASKESLLIAKTGRDDVLFDMLDDGTPLSIELGDASTAYSVTSDKKAFAEFDDCISGLELNIPTPIIANKTPRNLASFIEEEPLEKIIPPITPPSPVETISKATPPIKELVKAPEIKTLTNAPDFTPPLEEIVLLSKPVNPAQIGLEKTARRHSIGASSLLFDSPDAARLAVPSAMTPDTLVKTDITSTQPSFITEEPKPVLEEVAKAPLKIPPIVEKTVETVAPKIEAPEVITDLPKIIEKPQPQFTHNSVLPTASLVETPAPQIRAPNIISPVAIAPTLTPTPVLKTAEIKKEVKKPILEMPVVEVVEPTPVVPVLTKPASRLITQAQKSFIPPASPSVQDWTTKNISQTSEFPSYCLISNRFENGMGLYATRGPDGNSTLGLDFGFDILEPNRQYGVTVEVDHLFNEAFTAQASDDVMMVVQMGEQNDFFNALRQGKALHISMSGAASTFDLKNIGAAYSTFKQCLTLQNGKTITETAPTMPVVKKDIPITAPATQEIVPIKKITAPEIKTALPLFDKTPTNMVAKDISPAISKISTPPIVDPIDFSNFSRQFVQKGNHSTDNLSVSSILIASGITHSNVRIDDQNPDIMHWTTGNQNIQGILVETPWSTETSILDRLMEDIDVMEQTCVGEFTSQIGIPENYGQDVIASAETKCTINEKSVSAAHIYQGTGNMIKVWTQSGPSSLSSDILGSRNKIAGILRQRATANSLK